MKTPSFQFYPGDWRKDTALRMCSPAARGAWIDLLCLMFESSERGVLITNGKPWTVAQAARECGCRPKDIQELIENGVARVRDDGAIYCARMIRDEQARQDNARRVSEHRERQRKGPRDDPGNASCNGGVTPPVMRLVTPASRPSSSSSSSSPSGTKPPLAPPGGQVSGSRRARREPLEVRIARFADHPREPEPLDPFDLASNGVAHG